MDAAPASSHSRRLMVRRPVRYRSGADAWTAPPVAPRLRSRSGRVRVRRGRLGFGRRATRPVDGLAPASPAVTGAAQGIFERCLAGSFGVEQLLRQPLSQPTRRRAEERATEQCGRCAEVALLALLGMLVEVVRELALERATDLVAV